MSLFERGNRLLNRGTANADGPRTVTYSRPGVPAFAVTGVAGRTLFKRSGFGSSAAGYGGSAAVEWGDRDYYIPAAELAPVGEPKRGDRVTETIGGKVRVYELATPTGEPAWRYADPDETTVLVHTKRVS